MLGTNSVTWGKPRSSTASKPLVPKAQWCPKFPHNSFHPEAQRPCADPPRKRAGPVPRPLSDSFGRRIWQRQIPQRVDYCRLLACRNRPLPASNRHLQSKNGLQRSRTVNFEGRSTEVCNLRSLDDKAQTAMIDREASSSVNSRWKPTRQSWLQLPPWYLLMYQARFLTPAWG